MTCLAIRMSAIHRKPDFVSILVDRNVECTVSLDRNFIVGAFGGGLGDGRGKERISAFGTEEVLFVVSAFAEGGVVERDEAFVDNGSFAMVTLGGEFLREWMSVVPRYTHKCLYDTHFMIIQVAISLPVMFI